MNVWVLNFANSIVGVGILAVPFCFHICGIGMAILMILATNVLTRKTCEYLLKAGHLTRKPGYESLAQHHLGAIGKLVTELGIIGLMLGTLISFQVVIGDLSPPLINSAFGIEQTWSLRTTLMCLSSIGVIPLVLMRNIGSLANMNAMSMGFYCVFVVVVFFMSINNLTSGLWSMHVNFWRPEGFFHCLPIISLSFSCQSQVLIMYEAIPEQSTNIMMDIINKAIHLVTVMYMAVGFFGYVAFYESGIRGDILANFSSGLLADTIKTGFWISIVISFPLIIFPLRLSIHSLLFANENKGEQVVSSAADYIPQDRFSAITVLIVLGTLIIGILVPHIETVLSITGAVVGTFLCFVFPSALYLLSISKDHNTRTTAKVIFIVSMICMVASTLAVLSANDAHASTEHKEHPGHENGPNVVNPIKPFQLPGEPIKKGDVYKDSDTDGGGGVGAVDGNLDSKKEMNANIQHVKDSVEQDQNSANKIRGADKSKEKPKLEKADGLINSDKILRLNESQISDYKAVLRENTARKLKDAAVKESADLVKKKMAVPTSKAVKTDKGDDIELMRDKTTIEDSGGDDKKAENGNSIKSRKIKTILENAQIKSNGLMMSHKGESEQSRKNVSNFVFMTRNERTATVNNSVDRPTANGRSDARTKFK